MGKVIIYDNGNRTKVDAVIDANTKEIYIGCDSCGFPVSEASYCQNCGHKEADVGDS